MASKTGPPWGGSIHWGSVFELLNAFFNIRVAALGVGL